ncbi:hypothetical protein KAK07_06610 [Ideonella sp. 4Y16]|uniref:hypothetical protein n=1 Tax=Ideonella alba TaxID=2824118 RepID=UPI001B36B84D|nr:hypothetical protein [Ideonella alba]MBQ0943000.1 hypothetical protein [Ideonella alba]
MRIIRSLAVLSLAAAAAATFAATPNAGKAGAARIKDAATTVTYTTKAKVALYYSPSFGGVIHSKGIAAVSTPSTGIHCITPSIAVDLTKVTPQVTVDWNLSSGFALLAYTKDTSAFTDCPAGDLEVTTYDFNAGGTPVLSNVVAFNFVLE